MDGGNYCRSIRGLDPTDAEHRIFDMLQDLLPAPCVMRLGKFCYFERLCITLVNELEEARPGHSKLGPLPPLRGCPFLTLHFIVPTVLLGGLRRRYGTRSR